MVILWKGKVALREAKSTLSGTPILESSRELVHDWAPFLTFLDLCGPPPLYAQHDLIDPLILKNQMVCLYHI